MLPVLRIRNFFLSQIRIFPSRIPNPDPQQRILVFLSQENCTKALGNMIRDVYPGSGFFPIPEAGVKKAPHHGSGSITVNVAD
jgi:hypothetical protein